MAGMTTPMLLAKQPGDTGVFATATPTSLSIYRIENTRLTRHGRPALWQSCVPPLQRWRLDTTTNSNISGSLHTTPHEERESGRPTVGLPTSLSLSADSSIHFFVADQHGAGWIGHLGQERLARLFASSARLHKAQHERSATHHDAVYTTTDAVSSTTTTTSTDAHNSSSEEDNEKDVEGERAHNGRVNNHAQRGQETIDTLHSVQNLLWNEETSEEMALLRLRGVITASGWDPRNGAVLGLGRQDAVVQLLDVEYLVGGAGQTTTSAATTAAEMLAEESTGPTMASSFATSHTHHHHNHSYEDEAVVPVSGGSFASHHSSNHQKHPVTSHANMAGSVSNASVGQNTTTATGRETRTRSAGRRVKFATTARMQCSIIHERVLDGAVTAMDWIPMSHLTVVATRRQDQTGYSAEIMDLRAPDIHPRYLGMAPGAFGMPYRYEPLMSSPAGVLPSQGHVVHTHLYPTVAGLPAGTKTSQPASSSSSTRRCFADVLACEPGQTYIASAGSRDEYVDVVQLWDLRKTTQPVAEQLYRKASYTSLCWCPATRLTVLGCTRRGALRVHDFTQDDSDALDVDGSMSHREDTLSGRGSETRVWHGPSRTASMPHTRHTGSSNMTDKPLRTSSAHYKASELRSEDSESVREASTSEVEDSVVEDEQGGEAYTRSNAHSVQPRRAALPHQRQPRRGLWSAARCALPSRVPAAAVAWLTNDNNDSAITTTSRHAPSQDSHSVSDKDANADEREESDDDGSEDDKVRHGVVVKRGCRTDLPQLLLLSQTDGELYVQVYSRRGSLVTMFNEIPLVASGPNLFALSVQVDNACDVTSCGVVIDRTARMLPRAAQGLCIDPYKNAQLLLREGVDKEGFVLFLYGYVVARHLYPRQIPGSYVALPARKVLPSMLDLLRAACSRHTSTADGTQQHTRAVPISKSNSAGHGTSSNAADGIQCGSSAASLRTLFLQSLGWLPLTLSGTTSNTTSSTIFVDGDGIGMQDLQEAIERRVCLLVLLHEWQSAASLLAHYNACHPLYPGIALELSAAVQGGGAGQSALRAAVQCQTTLPHQRFRWFALTLAHLVTLAAHAEQRAAALDSVTPNVSSEMEGKREETSAAHSSSYSSSPHLSASGQPAQEALSVLQSQDMSGLSPHHPIPAPITSATATVQGNEMEQVTVDDMGNNTSDAQQPQGVGETAVLTPLTGQAALQHLYQLLCQFPTLPLTDQLGMAVALLLAPPSQATSSSALAEMRALMSVLQQLIKSQYAIVSTRHTSSSKATNSTAHVAEVDHLQDGVPGAHGRCSLLLAAIVHGMSDDMAALQAYVDETGDVQLPLCFVTAFGSVRGACYRAWVAAYAEVLNASAHYMLRCQHELQLLKAGRLRASIALAASAPSTTVPALLPSSALGPSTGATIGAMAGRGHPLSSGGYLSNAQRLPGGVITSPCGPGQLNTSPISTMEGTAAATYAGGGNSMNGGRGRAGLPAAMPSHSIAPGTAAPFGLFRAPDPMALALPSQTHVGSGIGGRGPSGMTPVTTGKPGFFRAMEGQPGALAVNAATVPSSNTAALGAANAACSVELRCNCGQAMHATAPVKLVSTNPTVAPHLTRRTRAPCGNPECQQWQAPMCTVCGERMEHKGMELSPARSFVWCTVCLHGGHWCHLREWFAKHRKCAVENCPCHCCTGSTL